MKLEPSTVGLFSRSNTRYFTNSGEANIRGLEISATWRPSPRTWLTAHHTALRIDNPNFSATEAKTNPAAGSNTARPAEFPPSSAWEFPPGWQFSFAKHWIWADEPGTRTTGTRPRPTASLDLRLACRLPGQHRRGEVSVTARNVDGPDQTYAPDTSRRACTIFASVNLEL